MFITTKDIYDQLVMLNGALVKTNEELARTTVLLVDTRETQTDMEARLRILERWKYGIPIACVMVIASYISQFVHGAGK